MGASCNLKERKNKNQSDYSHASSKNRNLVTKHSSQYKDLYSKYHLFENRWTTIRTYEKLPPMVLRNFSKVLERGINNKNLVKSSAKDQKENDPIFVTVVKPNKVSQINENCFCCESDQFYLNKMKTLNPDISYETHEYPEFSNLLYMNLNYNKQFDENITLIEEKNEATQKLNNILSSLNC